MEPGNGQVKLGDSFFFETLIFSFMWDAGEELSTPSKNTANLHGFIGPLKNGREGVLTQNPIPFTKGPVCFKMRFPSHHPYHPCIIVYLPAFGSFLW